MALSRPAKGRLFHGTEYMIRLSTNEQEILHLRRLLNDNGATDRECLSSPEYHCTRVITDAANFASFMEPKWKAVIVNPQWVYRSHMSGFKEPSQFYSADPAMIFSSIVLSAFRVTPDIADFLRVQTTKYGGQWLPSITSNVTHVISETDDFDSIGLQPIVVPLQLFSESVALHTLRFPQSAAFSSASFTSPAVATAATDQIEGKPARPLPYIPFEILAEIFISVRELLLEGWKLSTTSLLRLTQVCRRWRNVAHSTGELWTSLSFEFHSKRRFRRFNNLLGAWVARSGTRALQIELCSCYPRDHNPAIDFILSHASRIRELSVKLPEPQLLPLLEAAPGSFPILEKISLTIIAEGKALYDPASGVSRDIWFQGVDFDLDCDTGSLWPLVEQVSVLENTPRLRSFTIDAGIYDLGLDTLPLVWGNLTVFDLTSVSVNIADAVYILPMCTALVRLRFWTHGFPLLNAPLVNPVTIPNLQTLEWTGDKEHCYIVFGALVVPRLTSLHFSEARDEKIIYLLRARAGFSLENLVLSSFHLTFTAFSMFLRHMPSLTSLELNKSITIHGRTSQIFHLHCDNRRTATLKTTYYLGHRNEAPFFRDSPDGDGGITLVIHGVAYAAHGNEHIDSLDKFAHRRIRGSSQNTG
ncbi:hypothetical protein C8R43DRAFT_1113267 [Mycena crocata]|nr:hypothetical protein C8R43DRAFT_1113267 [Mycena crocata]